MTPENDADALALAAPDPDAVLSRDVAREAGALLLDVRRSFGELDPEDRDRVKAMRDTADREAHLLIERRLVEARPDDVLLSEEGVEGAARMTARRVWIVDPLDGTWEYGQGRDDFAVHVALWTRMASGEGVLSAATVDLPSQGITWSVLDAAPPAPALPSDRPVRVVVSRTRRPVRLDELVEGLAARLGNGPGVQVDAVGSVGAKVAELLAGRAELYVHDAGFHDWDLAAPLAVALHRGFWGVAPDDAGFVFNAASTVQPGVVLAAPALAPHVRAVLGLG